MKRIFGSLIIITKLLLHIQPAFLPSRFGLCQRPSSEKACSVLLPVLAMIEMWRGKKPVVRVAQRVAALVPVHGSSSLFPNMYCLFDPSSTFVRFSVQNCSDRPLNHMVMRLSLSPPWYHCLFLSRIHIRIGICSYTWLQFSYVN